MPRPKRLNQPRGLTFLIEEPDYTRLIKLLGEYRQEQPRAQMSDLLRQIIAQAVEREKASA